MVEGTEFQKNFASDSNLLKLLQTPRVTQIAVLEEVNILVLISAGSLIAHELDTLLAVNESSRTSKLPHHSGQKLSGAREVAFFAARGMKNGIFVIYMTESESYSTFTVRFSNKWSMIVTTSFLIIL